MRVCACVLACECVCVWSCFLASQLMRNFVARPLRHSLTCRENTRRERDFSILTLLHLPFSMGGRSRVEAALFVRGERPRRMGVRAQCGVQTISRMGFWHCQCPKMKSFTLLSRFDRKIERWVQWWRTSMANSGTVLAVAPWCPAHTCVCPTGNVNHTNFEWIHNVR